MEESKLQLLHEHYKDTCSVMTGYRKARDRYFYLVLIVLAVVIFDLYSPQDFADILSQFIRQQLQTTTAPDLRYIRSLIWFLLLGFTIRYCQTALHMERQYKYIHSLEETLALHFKGGAFTREGKAYLKDYQVFSTWVHYLYSFASPILLAVIVVLRTIHELRVSFPRTVLAWFDICVAIAMCISVVLYLVAFHNWRLPSRESRTSSDVK